MTDVEFDVRITALEENDGNGNHSVLQITDFFT